MKSSVLALTFVGLAFSTLLSGQGGDPQYGKPKRLNKMIELLEAGQPVYDVGVTGGGYEEVRTRMSWVGDRPCPATCGKSDKNRSRIPADL
jgi:hypothetical protein